MFKSIMAGVMIAIGGFTYLSCDNKYVGALLFSLGLYTIIRFGYRLYTGRIGYAVFDCYNLPDETDLKSKIFSLGVTYLGNIGGVCYALWGFWMTKFCSTLSNPTAIQEKAMAIASAKVDDSPLSLIMLGVGCGICMAIAAFGAKNADEHSITQPILVIFPVMVFILCGFEHCIADMFYLALAPNVSSLDAIKVIGCATIGNTLGGLLVGLSLRNK